MGPSWSRDPLGFQQQTTPRVVTNLMKIQVNMGSQALPEALNVCLIGIGVPVQDVDMSPFGAREVAMGPVNKAVPQSPIFLWRKLHAHELPPECRLLERDAVPGFNLHPHRVIQTRNPTKITRAVKVVVRHLKLKAFQELYLRQAALGAMIKF